MPAGQQPPGTDPAAPLQLPPLPDRWAQALLHAAAAGSDALLFRLSGLAAHVHGQPVADNDGEEEKRAAPAAAVPDGHAPDNGDASFGRGCCCGEQVVEGD